MIERFHIFTSIDNSKFNCYVKWDVIYAKKLYRELNKNDIFQCYWYNVSYDLFFIVWITIIKNIHEQVLRTYHNYQLMVLVMFEIFLKYLIGFLIYID